MLQVRSRAEFLRVEGNFSAGRSVFTDVTPKTKAKGRRMTVIDFLEYLAAHDHTRELASDLGDVWADQVVDRKVFEPAA